MPPPTMDEKLAPPISKRLLVPFGLGVLLSCLFMTAIFMTVYTVLHICMHKDF